MRVQTKINGITTTSTYEEGDCYSLVNLRKKNGALHPVTPRMKELDLQDTYDIVFVHSFNDYENWIGIKNVSTGGSDVYCNINTNPNKLFNTLIKYNADTVISVEQIGNTLSLITGNKILYLLHSDNDYKILGEIPEIEPIKWFNYGYYNARYYRDEYSTVTNDIFRSETIGLFNVLRKKIYDKHEGVLIDSHLMVFAFRLYDGSYIKQTSPVLLCGNLFETAFCIFVYLGGFDFTDSGVAINSRKVYLEFDTNYLTDWKDIIKSIDVFISEGLGNCSESNFTSVGNFQEAWDLAALEGNLFLFNLMNDNSLMIENIKSNANFYLIDTIPIGTVSQYDNNIDSDTNLKAMFCFPKKSVLNDIDTLTQKETLPVDTFSHHTITGNVSCAYNNRLHLAQIKTTLFSGFGIDFFLLPQRFLGESYFGIGYFVDIDGNIIRQNENPVKDFRFNGFSLNLFQHFNEMFIAVYLNIDGQTKIVYSKKHVGGGYFWLNPYFSYPDTRSFKAQFYDYDSFAALSTLRHEITLTPSMSINNSYYINSVVDNDLTKVSPPVPNISNPTQSDIQIPPVMPSYLEQNKLKVSALNDPFLFPNETTYLVSNGIILNMASIAIRISEGQFGQFPLYVFTNKGIYSMQIGSGEVVYALEAAPTSYEAPTTIIKNNIPGTIICSTPFGVIFISKRGVCIISGQAVELLTASLQQPPSEFVIESNQEIDEILHNFGEEPLAEYLETIRSILYDPKENEVILHNNGNTFNWVMNFDSKQFYQSTEKIDSVVQNTFPELKVIEGLKVKNYAQSGDDKARVSLITRPLIFGTTDFKKLERMFFRAILIAPIDPVAPVESVFINYYSIDEITFPALKGLKFNLNGLEFNRKGRKDFDMGLFGRSKYRQFMFAFAGTVNEKSEIQYLETEIIEEYNNTKMR